MEDDLVERIGYLCLMHGVQQSRDEVRTLADLYEREYRLHRRSVPGSRELLELLRKNVKTGVITNGLVIEQQEKIRLCQIGNLIDCLIISEEVGLRKPNKEIFVEALRRADTLPFETVYVGNSWDSDILPASQCGIKTIWLNRYDLRCPDYGVTKEIHSYVGLDIRKTFF